MAREPRFSLMPPQCSAESRLIVECATTKLTPPALGRVSALLRKDLDWDLLLQRAFRHGVLPLLCRNLLECGADLIPQEARERLEQHLLSHTHRNLMLTRELLILLNLFEARGIRAIPLKGPTLSAVAYGDLSLRHYVDLDIIVFGKELNRVEEVIGPRGYSQERSPSWFEKLPTPFSRKKDIGYKNESRGVRLELHWRLSGTHFDIPVDLNHLWDRGETIRLAGTDVRCLSTTDLIVYLCLHGSRHYWERLQWIVDIAELIRSRPEIDWGMTMARARSLGCRRVLALGLLLADDLCGVEIPVDLRREIQAEEDLRLVGGMVCMHILAPETSKLELSDWYQYHLRLKERGADRLMTRLHYGFRYLRIATKPNETDRERFPLPAAFYPLQYVYRPLRLINKWVTGRRDKHK